MTAPTTDAPLTTVAGVELARTGTWALSSGTWTPTREDFAAAVASQACPAVDVPHIRLGHIDPRFDGEPAVGSIENLRLADGGTSLVGDLAGVPAWLAERYDGHSVLSSAFPNRSVEGRYNHRCQLGHNHTFVLTGLALLGVTPPGVGTLRSLRDVAGLFGVEASADGTVAAVYGSDVTAAAEQHTGAMVALIPTAADAARLHVEGGEDPAQLHLTLVYLGDAADLGAHGQQDVIDYVSSAVNGLPVIDADAFALNVFNPPGTEREDGKQRDTCIVLGLSGDWLDIVHTVVADAVIGISTVEQHRPWHAHLTLAYTDDLSRLADLVDRVGPVRFDRVRLAFAGQLVDIPLIGDPEPLNDSGDDVAAATAGDGQQLMEYWLTEGAPRWVGSAHPWSTLYRLIKKHVKNAEKAKRITSVLYRRHFGHMPNQRNKVAAKFNPGQRRDGDGKWTDDGIPNSRPATSGRDRLRLAERAELDDDATVSTSGTFRASEGLGDLAYAVIDTGGERELWLTTAPDGAGEDDDDEMDGWTGDDAWTGKLDTEQVAELRADLTDAAAKAKTAAKAADAAWARGDRPDSDEVASGLVGDEFGSVHWSVELTDDEPTSWRVLLGTSATADLDERVDGAGLSPSDLRRFLRLLGDVMPGAVEAAADLFGVTTDLDDLDEDVAASAGGMPMPTETLSPESIRAAWNTSGAPDAQWVTEVAPDLSYVVVVRDPERTFTRHQVHVSARGAITFGRGRPIRLGYVDAAAPTAVTRTVFASRDGDPQPVVSTPVEQQPDTTPPPTEPATPAPVEGAPETPAAEPEPTTEPKEDPVSTLSDDMRSRLGLAEGADEAAALAAIDALKSKAETPQPDEVAASAAVAENAELRKEVTVLASQVKTMSDELAAAKAEKAATVKASVFDDAVKQGKIRPADRETWERDYDEAPGAVTRVLASIAPGTAVPVTASGVTGDPEPVAGDIDAQYEALVASIDGPARKGN